MEESKKSTLTLISLLIFTCFYVMVKAADHPEIHPGSFCYDDATCGPDTWGGVCSTGKEQSPIDIKTAILDNLLAEPTEFYMNEHYRTERIHQFFGQNNGHTVQFEFTPNTSALSSELVICGGELKNCYKFAQLHFHWGESDESGSEHTINQKRYPMELHIVHFKSKFNTLADALASNERDAVAVMAILYKIGQENRALNSIVRAVETLVRPGEVKSFHLPITVSALYPRSSSREFARYYGSLTTPTCDEKVIWTVFISPVHISEDQMMKFRRIRNSEGVSDFNFRPTQPLNGRNYDFYRSDTFRSIDYDDGSNLDDEYTLNRWFSVTFKPKKHYGWNK